MIWKLAKTAMLVNKFDSFAVRIECKGLRVNWARQDFCGLVQSKNREIILKDT
jgi:hypothetical protein